MSSSPPPLQPPSPAAPRDADAILARFIDAMAARGLELYGEQEEAILELFAGNHVVLNTPTGSGKSLVALALHYRALCLGERSVYTCPIKALVNEKFLALCRDFGPENVGMMTGDATVNRGAPILCCTAEILANHALSHGADGDFRAVIMDEFHYYGDADRGYAWQVPLLTLAHAQFLLMSATLPGTDFFEEKLTQLTGRPSVTVRSERRPVPLEFEYSETPLAEKIQALLDAQRAPIYLVHFTQRAASEAAQDLMSLAIGTREERAMRGSELEEFRFNSPYGREMKRWLRHGIGVHHAGLLPKYRVLVEKLAQRGLLQVISGTDTLGMGINVPIRTVLFTQLWKYDGTKAAVLRVRDFKQIAGRAGRKGFDDTGYVVAQAPEHVITNKRAAEKTAGDARKARKLTKARPPDGFVSWDEKTFARLQSAPPEALPSSFDVNHGMLLQVLSRDGDGCRAMQRLIRDCHETDHRKAQLRRKAWQLFRALLERKIVEFILPTPSGRKLRVNVELQDDFSLHQTLSLFLLDALPLLPSARKSSDDNKGETRFIASVNAAPDPGSSPLPTETAAPRTEGPARQLASPAYALDVLTLCEAIVEDPDTILRRQVDRLKSEKFAEMKAAGVEYEERIAKLEEIEHPKPLREFLYETFNRFAAAHPWVEQENVRPKSIAREMYERYLSFSAYVREYGLERSEGLLLRHLSQVWKVLAQTVPDGAKTEPVREMEVYFRELIRGIDSSLLEEWERLRDPNQVAPADAPGQPARPASYDITRDVVAFRRLVRTTIFGFLQDVVLRDWIAAAERLSESTGIGVPSEAQRIEEAFRPYFETRGRFRLDPAGRAAVNTHWSEDREAGEWTVTQVLVDTDDANDWEAVFTVSLARSRAENLAVVEFVAVHTIGST